MSRNIVPPKAPRPKIKIIPKIPSVIKLIEVDDDSDSECEIEKQQTNLSNCKNCKKQLNKYKDDPYLSDDRYEDSFDEEFGECETNPDSGKMKMDEED